MGQVPLIRPAPPAVRRRLSFAARRSSIFSGPVTAALDGEDLPYIFQLAISLAARKLLGPEMPKSGILRRERQFVTFLCIFKSLQRNNITSKNSSRHTKTHCQAERTFSSSRCRDSPRRIPQRVPFSPHHPYKGVHGGHISHEPEGGKFQNPGKISPL